MSIFTLGGFAAHLAKMVVEVEIEKHHALERAARIVEREAKDEIGHYQGAAGPFAKWEPLAQATLYGGVTPEGYHYQGKIALGYAPPDNPLLREGDMRDSIEHTVIGDTAYVGSNSQVAVEQELGTHTIPARSFLGGAAVRKKNEVGRQIGRDVLMVLSGQGNKTRIP